MKKIIVILFAAGGLEASAQQLQTSSLYDMQGVLHNPSMAGSMQKGMVGVSYRTQWTGVSGRPQTATIFGSFDLPAQKIGLGGYIYTDQTGPTKRTGLQIAFAKYIPLQNDAKLSFGIEARGTQFSIDRSKLEPTLGNDPVLQGGNEKMKFDAGFGISYITKKFQIGASVSQLIQSQLGFYNGTTTPTEEGRLYRHYYLHGAYNWRTDEDNVVTPYFMMIYMPNAPTEFVGGAKIEHKELFSLGIAARANQSFILTAGIKPTKKFTLGYAFDVYKTPFSMFENGANAHELLLRYNIN